MTFLNDSAELETSQKGDEGVSPNSERGCKSGNYAENEKNLPNGHELPSNESNITGGIQKAADKAVPVVTPNADAVQTATMNIDANSKDANVSFNVALRSALSTYSSTRALECRQVLPPPIPPPYLSHQEECTLRTALAFVMVQARKKNRDKTAVMDSGSSNNTLNQQVTTGRTFDWTKAIPNNSLLAKSREHSASIVRRDRAPSSLGAIFSIKPCLQARNAYRFSQCNAKLMFDREMNHIRDILRLAVSSVRPLYKGALRSSSNKDTSPCAVYDYEAAVMSSQELNAATSSFSEAKVAKQHYMNLDGLCQHVVVRVCRLIDDHKLIAKNTATLSAMSPSNDDFNEETGHDSQDSNNKNNDSPRSNHSNSARKEKSNSFDVSEAIIDLFCHDLIGEALFCGPSTLIPTDIFDGRSNKINSFTNLREERKIENVMSACHVFHRLLFLDKVCCFGTESVIAISRLLNDLYTDNICARFATGSILTNAEGQFSRNPNDSTRMKEKLKVVSSRWSQSAIDNIKIRRERRRQAIDSMSQQLGFQSEMDEKGSTGNKRPMSSDESLASTPYPFPSDGDVLAVNLLRLLEGAAAIRLHHRQQLSCQSNRRDDISMFRANVTSKTATEILTEIRSSTDYDLAIPLHIDDAATFYYNETRSRNGQSDLCEPKTLLPGAKMMLRLHFFSLVKKLVLYEQS